MTKKSTAIELFVTGAAGAGFSATVMGIPITPTIVLALIGGGTTAALVYSVREFSRWMLLPPAAELIGNKVCPHCDAHGTITELHRTNVYIAVFCEACKSAFDIRNTEDGVVALKTGMVND